MASSDEAAAAKAIGMIQELTATPELNKTYLGKVQRITDFGAFVEIMAGTDGLLHVSEIANHRVKDVRDELKEGQQILVKVINIDPDRARFASAARRCCPPRVVRPQPSRAARTTRPVAAPTPLAATGPAARAATVVRAASRRPSR